MITAIEISQEELKGLKAFNLGVQSNRPDLALLSDCLLMLERYLVNDARMDDQLMQKALKLAETYKSKS
jgi:hypothetical protein